MARCTPRTASVCHAVVAVFLQFFSWGLITAPMINILNTTFKVRQEPVRPPLTEDISGRGSDHERSGDGSQGLPQLPVRSADRSSV